MIPKNEFLKVLQAKIEEAISEQEDTDNALDMRLYVEGKLTKIYALDEAEDLYEAVANEVYDWFVEFYENYEALSQYPFAESIDVTLLKCELIKKFSVIRYYTYSVEMTVEATTPEQAFEMTAQEAANTPLEALEFISTDGFLVIDEDGKIVNQAE